MEPQLGGHSCYLEQRQLQAQIMRFDQSPVIRHLTNIGGHSTEGFTVLNNLRQARTFALKEGRKSARARVIEMALFVQSVIVGGKSTVLGEALYHGLSSNTNSEILATDRRIVTIGSKFGDYAVAGITYPWSACVDYAQRHGFQRLEDGSWSPDSLRKISAIPLSAKAGILTHLDEFLGSKVDVVIHAADGIPTYYFDGKGRLAGCDRNGSLLEHFARSPLYRRRLCSFHIVPDQDSVDSRLQDRSELHATESVEAYVQLMKLTGKPIVGDIRASFDAARKSAKPGFMPYLLRDVRESLRKVRNNPVEEGFSWHDMIALYEHYAVTLGLERPRTFIGYNVDIPDSEAQVANWDGFVSRFDAITWMQKHYPQELKEGLARDIRRLTL